MIDINKGIVDVLSKISIDDFIQGIKVLKTRFNISFRGISTIIGMDNTKLMNMVKKGFTDGYMTNIEVEEAIKLLQIYFLGEYSYKGEN